MSLTENSDQVFLPGGCNRTQNLRFGPYTIYCISHSYKLKVCPRKIMVVNLLSGIEKVSVLRQGWSILKYTNSAAS